MLKTLLSSESLIRLKKAVVGVSDNNRAWRDRNKLDGSKLDGVEVDGVEVDGVEVDGGEVEVDKVEKKVQKTSKSKNLSKSKKKIRFSDFLTLKAKLAFTELRQVFFKASILHHFDLKRHIKVETDVSGYAIDGVFSQLTSDDSSR